MKIEVPRIYRPIELGEYAEELKGEQLHVWVNPPRRLLAEYAAILKHVLKQEPRPRWWDRILSRLGIVGPSERRSLGWFGKVWSEDGAEAIGEQAAVRFALQLYEADPVLYQHLIAATMQLLDGHQDASKKAMGDAMLEVNKTGRTAHPQLARLFIARTINHLHGGPVIGAWDIDGLPDDWVAGFLQYASGQVVAAESLAVNQILEPTRARWRAQHPTYRKARLN